MRGDDGSGIPGESSDDSTWEGGGDTTELENTVRKGRATDISNVIPGEWRPKETPSGGMPGPSGDKDGNEGAIPALVCPRHHGNSVGEKPPPPTVNLMRHAGPPAGTERQAPYQSPVCQGIRAGDAAARGGGDEGELVEGL